MANKKTITVSAVEGIKVPIEGNARRYVEGTREVPATAYYRRAILRGTLTDTKKAKAKAPSKKTPTDRAEREEK